MSIRDITSPGGILPERLGIGSWGPRLLGIGLALVLWFVVASVFPNELLPFPLEAAQHTVALGAQQSTWFHVGMTFWRMAWAFGLAMIFGTGLGVVMGATSYWKKFLTPYVVLGLSVPSVAWAAIGFLVFGFSLAAPVLATVAITLPYITVNIWKGVEDLDPDRIGLLGFSQGAITSMSALLERPELYRWVVALNGYLATAHEDAVENAGGKPVFIGCGSMDQIIPPERAERAAERLEAGGAEVRFQQYGVGHGTTPDEVTDVVAWLQGRY